MYDNLIDDYINDVTKDMGAEQRKDVAKELRTHILDSADALAAEKKIPVDDVIVREVISKMGPADRIALRMLLSRNPDAATGAGDWRRCIELLRNPRAGRRRIPTPGRSSFSGRNRSRFRT